MKRQILNLEGVIVLTKAQQKAVIGGEKHQTLVKFNGVHHYWKTPLKCLIDNNKLIMKRLFSNYQSL